MDAMGDLASDASGMAKGEYGGRTHARRNPDAERGARSEFQSKKPFASNERIRRSSSQISIEDAR
jgi:hypothetical protein